MADKQAIQATLAAHHSRSAVLRQLAVRNVPVLEGRLGEVKKSVPNVSASHFTAFYRGCIMAR